MRIVPAVSQDERKVPTGRFGRLARLATAGVRAGVGAVLAPGDASTALEVARALGTMRGLAAKMGQMAGYVDGLVPEGQREAYEVAMKGLQRAAPPSPYAEVRAIVEAELGAPPERAFATFDATPFASASLGQVHRARLHSGEDVAVKVQHPGVDRALEGDLANTAIIEGLAALGGAKRESAKAMAAVVRKRFLEELDYGLEAASQASFARFFEADPRVRVPRVFAEHSSRRVLTSEFVSGLGFDEACGAPEPERQAWCETLWQFVFKGSIVLGSFNADPHPGNYLFHPGGAVTFLDFGCIQPLPPERQPKSQAVHRAAVRGDEAGFRLAVARLLESPPGPYAEAAVDYTRRCFEPIFASPYRLTRAYAGSLFADVRALAAVARKHLPEGHAPIPPEVLFLNRLQFGFYSVLARLDARVDYRAVEASFLDEPAGDGPPRAGAAAAAMPPRAALELLERAPRQAPSAVSRRQRFLPSGGDACLDPGVFDLHAAVPGGPWEGSAAQAVAPNGDAVGVAVRGEEFGLLLRAVLWRGNEARVLQDLIKNPEGWEVQSALGINARGEIVGFGVYQGDQAGAGLLLTPDRRSRGAKCARRRPGARRHSRAFARRPRLRGGAWHGDPAAQALCRPLTPLSWLNLALSWAGARRPVAAWWPGS